MLARIKPKEFESRWNSFFISRSDALHVYMCAWMPCCFNSLISTQNFWRALTASLDSCAEIKSAPSVAYPILVEFGGRCRKVMLGVWAHSLLQPGCRWCMHVERIPVNMPDPFRKHFGYGQHAARIGLGGIYARSDSPRLIQFCFSKEGMDHIAQNRPGSDMDGLVRVWPNTSGLEAGWCAGIIWPGFWQWQDATGPLPVSYRLGSGIPQTSQIILCKTPQSWFSSG